MEQNIGEGFNMKQEMHEMHEKSPFAALTPQEQKEQWICWQAVHQRPCAPEPFPEMHLPKAEIRRETPPPMPVARHSQYDAVIKRMKQARSRAQCDQSWD